MRVSGTLSRAYTIRSLSAAFVELARPASARRRVVGMPRSLSAIAIPVALAIPSARMALMTGHRGPSASSAPAAARLKRLEDAGVVEPLHMFFEPAEWKGKRCAR